MADFAFFFLALGCYGLFLVLAVVTRAGRGRTPLARFNKLHFRTAVAYLVTSIAWTWWGQAGLRLGLLADFLVGLFLYFGIHYAIGANFFVLAQASVSTAIIAIVDAHGGRTTQAECARSYAGGQGFAYLKQNRMARLRDLLGWVAVADGQYRLTRAGKWMTQLTRQMLRLWGLKQLGAGR